MTDAVPAVQQFSLELYRKVAESAGNVVVSPYSVATALAMAMVGARGGTAEEFRQLLHVEDAGAYGRSLTELPAQAASEDVVLEVANSLWVQQGTQWHRDFVDTLAADFGADPQQVDFVRAADAAAKSINSWVAELTRDKITDLLDSSMFSELTRLVLVNAAYFKAQWEDRFDPAQPGSFTTGSGQVVTAQLMSKTVKRVRYHRGEDWQAVAVPFRGGRIAMGLVLPAEGTELSEVVDSLSDAGIGSVLAGMRQVPEVELRLPRWKFRTNTTLTRQLTALGLGSAFGGSADFSGMTDAEQMVISEVVHEAFVAVDEEGAEAAAATAVIVRAMSARQTPQMIMNRPFLFMIYDTETGVPFFLGRVDDPTQ